MLNVGSLAPPPSIISILLGHELGSTPAAACGTRAALQGGGGRCALPGPLLQAPVDPVRTRFLDFLLTQRPVRPRPPGANPGCRPAGSGCRPVGYRGSRCGLRPPPPPAG